MRHLHLLLVAGIAVLWGFVPSVQAMPIRMDFTVAGFNEMLGFGTPAPTDSISGTITWDAASVHGTINALVSINLTVNGYEYSPAEVGHSESVVYPGDVAIGGIADGIAGIGNGTDDFWIHWDRAALTPWSFAYTSSGLSGLWSSGSFATFSVTEGAPVPEPATMLLLGAGLIGLAGFSRKKFRKK